MGVAVARIFRGGCAYVNTDTKIETVSNNRFGLYFLEKAISHLGQCDSRAMFGRSNFQCRVSVTLPLAVISDNIAVSHNYIARN